jgi:pimeloyl-ACP methyl ester carboxylesterase
MTIRNPVRKLAYTLLLLFLLVNGIAALHAWRFTHFTAGLRSPIDHTSGISFRKKLWFALTGVPNAKPLNTSFPATPYETITLQSNVKISCWYLPVDAAKGTVVLFHGYGGCKSQMLDKAYVLRKAGYHVLLADFMGAGASEGNQVTIGYKEAENVKTCYDYIRQQGKGPVVLMGSSMGAVAILRYTHLYPEAQPDGIIIECPFGSLYETVGTRFNMMGMPSFPLAGLLTFWGGVENGFNAFSHRPITYASALTCPSLLIFGEQDDRVTRKEINDIFNNLNGPKELLTLPLAGHTGYLQLYQQEWTNAVTAFLNRL